MDRTLTETLKTVCSAGFAREGFNSEANKQLEELANVGLLVVEYAPRMLGNVKEYRPSEKGWALFKNLLAGRE